MSPHRRLRAVRGWLLLGGLVVLLAPLTVFAAFDAALRVLQRLSRPLPHAQEVS